MTHFWTNDLEYIGQDHKPLCGPGEFKGDWSVGFPKSKQKFIFMCGEWRISPSPLIRELTTPNEMFCQRVVQYSDFALD